MKQDSCLSRLPHKRNETPERRSDAAHLSGLCEKKYPQRLWLFVAN